MKFWKRMVLLASVLGPGIITANIDNDASGITTYSVAGARFGYGLLWTLIPTTVALVVIQEMVARMGVITGKGLSHLIREQYGVKTAFYLMLGLLVANFGTTVANFAGWAASMEMLGLSKYFLVPAGAVVIWMLVTKGSYRAVERVLLGACLIYLGYIISGIVSEPDWGAIAREAVMPRVPWQSEYLFLGIAVVGTTITPWMQFYLQSSIVEKGVKPEHYRATRLDVVAGSLFTNVISFFIIVTCGTLLFPYGIHINEASEAAIALRPLAGDRASLIFAVSLANASLLGAIVVPPRHCLLRLRSYGLGDRDQQELQRGPSVHVDLHTHDPPGRLAHPYPRGPTGGPHGPLLGHQRSPPALCPRLCPVSCE